MASSTVVHETTSQDKQLGTALPLQSATSQSAQTNHPRENERAGCKSPHPHLSEGQGEVFFLDILFHRMSVMAWLHKLWEPSATARSTHRRGSALSRLYGEISKTVPLPDVPPAPVAP